MSKHNNKTTKASTAKHTAKPVKKKKTIYYNAALVSRGAIRVWLGSDAIASWHNMPKTGKAGHPKTYSDLSVRL